MRIVRKIFPHLFIILGGMFLTFTVLNHFNNAMNFINNEISITLIFIWAILSLVMGGIMVADDLRASKSNKNIPTRNDDSDQDAIPSKPRGAQRYKRNI